MAALDCGRHPRSYAVEACGRHPRSKAAEACGRQPQSYAAEACGRHPRSYAVEASTTAPRRYRERLLGTPEPDHDDAAALALAFLRHTQAVRDHVPSGRLLVHEARDGWAPICAFLGKPIPPTPYPRINESASFQTPIKCVKAFLVLFYGSLGAAAAFAGARAAGVA